MTTTLPPKRPPAAAAPARPIVPRPLWERHRLFIEPDLPQGADPEDDDGDDEDAA